jgi:hypothetical protein
VRLRYRSVVHARDLSAYAPWVRELRHRNGVYVVRSRGEREVLYVGESHSCRLYSTLTRHFQYWKGYTAGTTYDRDHVEVAVTHLDEPSKAVVHAQVSLIEELAPRDNAHHQLDDELDDDFDPDFADDWD